MTVQRASGDCGGRPEKPETVANSRKVLLMTLLGGPCESWVKNDDDNWQLADCG